MASILAIDNNANQIQDTERMKRINEKLLYLLNKYRCAYLKSLELILFYEKILKRNYEKEENPDFCDSFRKKRQNETCVLEEEQFLRKRFKADILRGVSVDIIPYKEEVSGKENVAKSSTSVVKGCTITDELGNEQNKTNYVNLDTLDFSAYAEDDEGSIKYYENVNEKEKEKTLTKKKTAKESTALRSVYNNPDTQKKAPLTTQSKYGKPALKSTYSRTTSSIYKGATNEKVTKGPNIPLNPSFVNKSTYQRSGTKHLEIDKKSTVKNIPGDKKEINRSVYVSNTINKPAPNANRSVYVGHKNISNKINNLMDSVYIGSKFMPNKSNTNIHDKSAPHDLHKNLAKQRPNDTVKKTGTLQKPNNLQNSVIAKNAKFTNTSNQSVYINRQIPNRNVSKENSSAINSNLKGRGGIINEAKNELTGVKLKMENDLSIGGKNNVHVAKHEQETWEQNNKKRAREELLEDLQVKIENDADAVEETVGENKETRSYKGRQHEVFLPMTMNYIDELIENEEKNKTEKGRPITEYIMVLQNEKKKDETKRQEGNKFALHDLTQEEYKWIIEYRTKGTKPPVNVKTEENASYQLHKNVTESKEKKEVLTMNEPEIPKGYQGNESKSVTERDTVRNFRMGGTVGFGKLRCPITENAYKTGVGKTVKETNQSTAADYSGKQLIDTKQNNEGEKYVAKDVAKDAEQKKEYASDLHTMGIRQNEQLNDFRNALLSINQQIIQKKNRDNICEETKEVTQNKEDVGVKKEEQLGKSQTTSATTSNMIKQGFKNIPFLPPLKNNVLLTTKKDTTKTVSSNRANIYIELNANYEFMTLDAIDIDNVINEGLFCYRNVEESYIESSSNIKDMAVYNEIMKSEKKTYYLSIQKTEKNDPNMKETKIEVYFKSGNEIKNEFLKLVGVSIFQNMNVTLNPATSLITDDKLVLWFTKKKREKGINDMNFADSNSSQLVRFKRAKKRPSNMGIFSQPLTIMLSSLKRQSNHTSLKKLIRTLILCSCDSSSLEKIVHTVPDENNKNYAQWKDSLYKLGVFVGERKSTIIKKLVELGMEDSDDEVLDDEIGLTRKEEEYGYMNDPFNGFGVPSRNNLDSFHFNAYDRMKGGNIVDTSLNNSVSSSATTTNSTSTTHCNVSNDSGDYTDKKKEHVDIYEEEEFCLFIATIENAHKRLQYLLLVENFTLIYEDLLTHIKNKLHSIELIIGKHVQLKQLFCNVLFLCNWLNEPTNYKWFLWNDILKKMESLCGYLENGKISRDRNIMRLLAEHTGPIFTDQELHDLKKISKFHIKDLYDKSIDFINSYLELKNQMDSPEFKKSCCISIDGIHILPEDQFLEKIKNFVHANYKQMLYIIWNLDLLIKKYIFLIIWLGDIRPFYPLFSYMDINKKKVYSLDLFVKMVHFFESYNKYIHIIKKENDGKAAEKKKTYETEQLDVDMYAFPMHTFSNVEQNKVVHLSNEQRVENFPPISTYTKTLEPNKWNTSNEIANHNTHFNNTSFYKISDNQDNRNQMNSLSTTKREVPLRNRYDKITNDSMYREDDLLEAQNEIATFPELKKRKSLTNTVNYACEIKRKSIELEQVHYTKKKSSSSGISIEFELSD